MASLEDFTGTTEAGSLEDYAGNATPELLINELLNAS